MKILDDGEREKLLGEACEIVFNDVALIPLHHEVLVLGARKEHRLHAARRSVHARHGRDSARPDGRRNGKRQSDDT